MKEKEADWEKAYRCMQELKEWTVLGFFRRPKIHVKNWYRDN